MKKIIGIMLVVFLIGSFLFPTGRYTLNASELTAQEKYDALVAKGIFEGINGEAKLDQDMNRAQFARVAALILGLDGIGTPDTKVVKEAPFSDVSLSSWYVEEIAAAKEAHIMVGNADGTFNPRGDISVQELAIATVRMLNLEPVEGAEVTGAADWAAGYIQAIINAGVDFPTNYTEPASRKLLVTISFQTEIIIAESKVAEETEQKELDTEESTTNITSPPIVHTPSKVLTPTANHAEGAVLIGTPVSLSATGGSTIYYTIDGSTPSISNGLVYSQPIVVNNALTIKALAVKNGMIDSDILISSYTISSENSALDLINDASESGDWTGVDESTFAEAGITGVTDENLQAVFDALEDIGLTSRSVAQIQDIVNSIIGIAALASINASAESKDWTGITVDTFVNAGMNDVTTENIIGIMIALEYGYIWDRTSIELQGDINVIIASIQTALEDINAASISGDWDFITDDQLSMIGVWGIHVDNYKAITDELKKDVERLWSLTELQVEINRILENL